MTSDPAAPRAVRELAPAKVNLVLQVGPRRADGLHEICSLFASIDLADDVLVAPSARGDRDRVTCPGVEGPNLAETALAAIRAAVPAESRPPPLEVTIDKRIPVAGGLGGGSADAAAVLRAANALTGRRMAPDDLRAIGAEIGADVPSQVEPAHALVTGTGERVEPIALPPIWLVLAPAPGPGLSTAEVYREADRIGATRERLDPDGLRAAAGSLETLVHAMENDLEAAALSLRPELADTLAALRRSGALAARVTGSGPTAFGVFAERDAAARGAADLPAGLVAGLADDSARRAG